jgi:hypothetical protein
LFGSASACSSNADTAAITPANDSGGDDGATGDVQPDGGQAEGGDDTSLSALTVSTGTLIPAFDPGVTEYSITSLNSLYPISVTATAVDPSAVLTVHGTPAQSGVPVSVQLAPGEDLAVVVQSGASSQTYSVDYLPADLPMFDVTGTPTGNEDIVMTPGGTYDLIVDRNGAPLYYRNFLPQHVGDFKQHVLPSGVFYSTQVGVFNPNGWQLGVQHLMDSKFQDLGDVRLLANRAHGALAAEMHDFLLLAQDHYVAESYVQRTVDLSGLDPSWSSQAQVMNAVVQEVVAGSVVFEWDSGDVLSLYTDSVDGNANFGNSTGVSDYLHLNSLDIDPADGNFIFSFRHTNSIVKVDRSTGAILWTLGGAEDNFGLTQEQVFSHQHYAKMQPDGSLLVFDNGNGYGATAPHQTRILSFVLDGVGKTVTSFDVVYTKPSDQPQSAYMGSAVQTAADRYIFGWGGWPTSDIAPAVTEVVSGSPVWTLTFTQPTVNSYRSIPIPALSGSM